MFLAEPSQRLHERFVPRGVVFIPFRNVGHSSIQRSERPDSLAFAHSLQTAFAKYPPKEIHLPLGSLGG
jgi:hypothetical protein